MDAWAIWLIAAFVLLIAEMLSLTFFLLWLGIGSLAGALTAWLAPDNLVVQVVVAALVAIALTTFTKPLTRRLRTSSRGYKDEIDQLVGKTGVVTEAIEAGKTGIVKIGSETWSAYAGEPIGKDESVIIVSRGTTQVEVRKWGGDR